MITDRLPFVVTFDDRCLLASRIERSGHAELVDPATGEIVERNADPRSFQLLPTEPFVPDVRYTLFDDRLQNDVGWLSRLRAARIDFLKSTKKKRDPTQPKAPRKVTIGAKRGVKARLASIEERLRLAGHLDPGESL